MNKEQVIELMRSSTSKDEWNNNCDTIKRECGGYPFYWYDEIVKSGLIDEVLGEGSSQIKFLVYSNTK